MLVSTPQLHVVDKTIPIPDPDINRMLTAGAEAAERGGNIYIHGGWVKAYPTLPVHDVSALNEFAWRTYQKWLELAMRAPQRAQHCDHLFGYTGMFLVGMCFGAIVIISR